VRRIVLPTDEDVCSFLLQHSEDDLGTLIKVAPIHVGPPAPIRRSSWDWDTAGSSDHRDKLVRIVSEDIQLRPRSGEFVGLCPFHEEKSPSFSVNPRKGLYRCFGCDVKGDVITYLRQTRDLSFREAMNYLEDYK
jgi:hypothetical protein